MKVLLKADVKGIGKKGEVVEVADGYGRNFLIKKGFATIASASNIHEAEQKKEAVQIVLIRRLRLFLQIFTT